MFCVSKFAAELTNFVVRPRARGFGLARWLLEDAEAIARSEGLVQIDAHVRADRSAALALIEEAGYERWATKERYARIGEEFVPGHYYAKALDRRPPYRFTHQRAMAGA